MAAVGFCVGRWWPSSQSSSQDLQRQPRPMPTQASHKAWSHKGRLWVLVLLKFALSLLDMISGALTPIVLALKNSDVKFTVVDKDESVINSWNSNHLPLFEPGLEEIFFDEPEQKVHEDGQRPWRRRLQNIAFSIAMDEYIMAADMIFICVNTPIHMNTRNSTAISLAQGLHRFGAKVRLYDPRLRFDQIECIFGSTTSQMVVADIEDACRGCHALVIHTNWDEFADWSIPW
ncbi:hypothetical protein BDV27DRAFT_155745 [Aspergillus caelatus]|uniref:UDP-glucose/GDP-mannose dehydrogenase C-terminal domain-containing protein n=1 Tax=Aspergillus caelatus TaxID=61420 RepID=A0A5N7AA61_9EURO|nr:uncharacterized protein BDV27DRAFT_155745 [Aspergillus caelatus]KAE8366605.1 hypothetical protein BDV27DRAFT_155745 [Aspergillus caelatus]